MFFENLDIDLALTNIFNRRPILLSEFFMNVWRLTSRPKPEKKCYSIYRYLLKFACSIISDSFGFLLKENRSYVLSGYMSNISYYWFPFSRAHFYILIEWLIFSGQWKLQCNTRLPICFSLLQDSYGVDTHFKNDKERFFHYLSSYGCRK